MSDRLKTLGDFAAILKALLKEAMDAGLDVNEICEMAEHILSDSWED
jgi:methionine aminopeptidase